MKGSHVGNDHEGDNNYHNKFEGADVQRDLVHDTREHRNPSVSTSSSVRSLADLVGDRRSTIGFAETSSRGSDANAERSRRRRLGKEGSKLRFGRTFNDSQKLLLSLLEN